MMKKITFKDMSPENRRDLNYVKRKFYGEWAKKREVPFNVAEAIIITSRREKYKAETLNWLKNNGVEYKEIHFMTVARTFASIVAYKTEKIKELGVTVYYEDDKKIARALERKCEGVEIRHINSENDVVYFEELAIRKGFIC
jgi:hypothetical protein